MEILLQNMFVQLAETTLTMQLILLSNLLPGDVVITDHPVDETLYSLQAQWPIQDKEICAFLIEELPSTIACFVRDNGLVDSLEMSLQDTIIEMAITIIDKILRSYI